MEIHPLRASRSLQRIFFYLLHTSGAVFQLARDVQPHHTACIRSNITPKFIVVSISKAPTDRSVPICSATPPKKDQQHLQ